ncbi:uncharacterized protein UTRI_04499 [Ustilago trichophora]|uniref:Uncharacterized protein n=1 Tax=Ustilago trichophora TaxID=86804 RepID=A0A5C3EGP8_9BASI|nr:uncharacterized protein UTRI_04499 [Ustilago trichophora]
MNDSNSSVPLPSTAAPQVQQAFSSLAQVFESMTRADAIDHKLKSMEATIQNLSASLNRTQEILSATQTELTTCRASNHELQQTVGKCSRHILNQDSVIAKLKQDIINLFNRFNAISHGINEFETRVAGAHHQLKEGLTHTLRQQDIKIDNFQNRIVGPLFSAFQHVIVGSVAGSRPTDPQVAQGSPQQSARHDLANLTQQASIHAAVPSNSSPTVARTRSISNDSNTPLAQTSVDHAAPRNAASAMPIAGESSELTRLEPSPASHNMTSISSPTMVQPSPLLPSSLAGTPNQVDAPQQARVRLPPVSIPPHPPTSTTQSPSTPATTVTATPPVSRASSSSLTITAPISPLQQTGVSVSDPLGESPTGLKRKRTPSVEHIRTQLAKTCPVGRRDRKPVMVPNQSASSGSVALPISAAGSGSSVTPSADISVQTPASLQETLTATAVPSQILVQTLPCSMNEQANTQMSQPRNVTQIPSEGAQAGRSQTDAEQSQPASVKMEAGLVESQSRGQHENQQCLQPPAPVDASASSSSQRMTPTDQNRIEQHDSASLRTVDGPLAVAETITAEESSAVNEPGDTSTQPNDPLPSAEHAPEDQNTTLSEPDPAPSQTPSSSTTIQTVSNFEPVSPVLSRRLSIPPSESADQEPAVERQQARDEDIRLSLRERLLTREGEPLPQRHPASVPLSAERRSRIQFLAGLRSQSCDTLDQFPFFIWARLCGSHLTTPLVITRDPYVTESLISVKLADSLIRDGQARRADVESFSERLEIDLAWSLDSDNRHRRAGEPYVQYLSAKFLIVPTAYMSGGIVLGRDEQDRHRLQLVPKTSTRRAYLAVDGRFDKGVNLLAFPLSNRQSDSVKPFERLCKLAAVATDRKNALKETARKKRSQVDENSVRGSTSLWDRYVPKESYRRPDAPSLASRLSQSRPSREYHSVSARPSTSGLSANSIAEIRGTLFDRDSNIVIPPPISLPQESLQLETLRNGDISKQAPRTRARTLPSSLGENSTTGHATQLDSGSPLSELSRSSDVAEADEPLNEDGNNYESLAKTYAELSPSEQEECTRRTLELIGEQSVARAQPSYSSAKFQSLSVMGASKRAMAVTDPRR